MLTTASCGVIYTFSFTLRDPSAPGVPRPAAWTRPATVELPLPAVSSLLLCSPGPPPLQRRGHSLQPTSGENVWNSVSALGSGRWFFFLLDFPTNFHFHVNSNSFVVSVPDYIIVTTMASSPQKSPSSPKSPTPKSPSSRKKDDSFLGKLGGTLARRKKAKEGKQLAKQRDRNYQKQLSDGCT